MLDRGKAADSNGTMRRRFLQGLGGIGALAGLGVTEVQGSQQSVWRRPAVQLQYGQSTGQDSNAPRRRQSAAGVDNSGVSRRERGPNRAVAVPDDG